MELLLSSFTTFLIALIPLSPILATAIVGLVLCRKKLARFHPQAKARATLGWVLLILHAALGRGSTVFITIYAAQSGDRAAYSGWYGIANLASMVLLLASLILLLQSILADRSGPESLHRAA